MFVKYSQVVNSKHDSREGRVVDCSMPFSIVPHLLDDDFFGRTVETLPPYVRRPDVVIFARNRAKERRDGRALVSVVPRQISFVCHYISSRWVGLESYRFANLYFTRFSQKPPLCIISTTLTIFLLEQISLPIPQPNDEHPELLRVPFMDDISHPECSLQLRQSRRFPWKLECSLSQCGEWRNEHFFSQFQQSRR
jgi:hypothetical protein